MAFPLFGSDSEDSDDGLSLGSLFSSTIQSVQDGLTQGLSERISGGTRSSSTQPVPDIAAQAATPRSGFISVAGMGVSTPVLIIGVAAIAFLLLKGK